MSRPLVAVVGRPNVGKSTLFNRLIGRRVAIVEDVPGITRDRLYHNVEWLGREFTLIDTGGIIPNETDPLTVQVRLQAEIAMEEADLILFIVDAGDGMTRTDQDLADALRQAKCPILLVVNKTDNPRLEADATEFYSLGYAEMFTISAIHGRGVADLLDKAIELLPKQPEEEGETEDQIRLAIIGRPNVGKSSLLNAILGENRAIVSPIPGTTRDAVDTLFEWDNQQLVLVDTAGIRRNRKIQGTVEYYMVLRARSALERSNVAVVVIDGKAGLMDGDKRVAGMAHENGRACIVVVNKWDLVDPGVVFKDGKLQKADMAKITKFTDKFRDECPFLSYAPLVFISAQEQFSIREVLDTAITSAQNHAFRIPTGELNRLIRESVERRPHSAHGRALKIYYATMASVEPPTIILFCNDPDLCHFSYQRYLENRIREVYPMEGTPIRLLVRAADKKDRDDDD